MENYATKGKKSNHPRPSKMTKNERVFEIIEISRIYDCFAPNTIYYGPRTNEYAARTSWEHANT